MSKFLASRADRAAQAFGTLRSKGVSVAKAAGTSMAVGAALVANNAMALTATQNTAVEAAYTATGASVELIIAGLLAVGLLITGFGIIWSMVRK